MNPYKDTVLTWIICYLLSLVVCSIAGILLFFPIAVVIIYFFPSTIYIDGEYHSGMPIGQLFTSGIISIIITLTFSIILFRKIKKRITERDIGKKI